jgi:hypothetical protein
MIVASAAGRQPSHNFAAMRHCDHKARQAVKQHKDLLIGLLDGKWILGGVAICVGICLAQSPIQRGYWIRQRGQSARR